MIRFFDFRKSDYPYHFWLIQFVSFSYCLLRLLSRDYTIYGLIPEEYFNYNRPFLAIYPKFIQQFCTLHFVYWLFDYPSPFVLNVIKYVGLTASFFGLLGIFPKVMSFTVLLILVHFTGFVQATNAELEGGTVLLITLLIMCLSHHKCFYNFSSKQSIEKNNRHRLPVFLLFLSVGFYYSSSGLNKLVDVGPHWPFVLNLQNLGHQMIDSSAFISSRYSLFEYNSLLVNGGYWFSCICGVITLISEFFFLSILFVPRLRFFIIFSIIMMHLSVYLSCGINFLGSTFIVLLCLDYNLLFRKSIIYFDGDCGICDNVVKLLTKLDLFQRLEFVDFNNSTVPNVIKKSRLPSEMALLDEDGSIYYGSDAFEIIFHKIALCYPLAILYKIPGFHLISKYIYSKFASGRHLFSKGSCSI